ISDSLPFWPINPMLAASPWFTFQLDLARTIWTILLPTILWGASFPLAFAAVTPGPKDVPDPGRTVGRIYAANTLGAIAGALGVSLILIPWIGTQQTQRVLIVLSAVAGLVVLAPHLKSIPVAALAVMALAIIGRLAYGLHPVPGELIAYGRRM